MKRKINLLLSALILLDLSLSITALFFPHFWIETVHGLPVGDPLGLVRRLGAGWAAFFLFQVIARLRWEKHADWLAVVAGVRFTELFADWVYLGFAERVTSTGMLGLGLSPFVNVLAGWYLLKSFRALQSGAKA